MTSVRRAFLSALVCSIMISFAPSGETNSSIAHAQSAASCVNPPVRMNPTGQTVTLPPHSNVGIYIDPNFSASEVSDIKAAAAAWQNANAFWKCNIHIQRSRS